MKRAYGTNQVRIISGQWRGRRISFADVPGLRPTGDRVRETLFNWLQAGITGAACLDLFAGSGALGLEAASRGAGHVVLVEQDARVCRQLRGSLEALQTARVTLVEQDALAYLAAAPRPFDIVFVDPPFGEEHVPAVARALQSGWLAQDARIYVEQPADARTASLPWRLLKHKTQGNVLISLYAND